MSHYEIVMIDTDPDIGKETELVLSISSNEMHANMIAYCLNQTNDSNPNRIFTAVKSEKQPWQ